MAIFDRTTIKTFEMKGGKLRLLESLKRPLQKRLWKESFADAGDAYVARSIDGDDLKIFLDSIDKKTLKETIEPAKGNSVYASATDGKYFYATVVFTDKIDFYKYDLSMKEVIHTSIPNGETINASNQFLCIDDNLYLLVSNVVRDSGETQTELWKMSKDFEILEQINLEESGALLRMANHGHTLFISELFEVGRDAGEPRAGHRLLIYDLDKRSKKTIELSIPYPNLLYYDTARNSVIIENDGHFNQDFPWSIINLATREEKILTFPDFSPNDYQPPFFTMQGDDYYFLFKDTLIVYHPDTEQKDRIDLKEYGITDAHALILK